MAGSQGAALLLGGVGPGHLLPRAGRQDPVYHGNRGTLMRTHPTLALTVTLTRTLPNPDTHTHTHTHTLHRNVSTDTPRALPHAAGGDLCRGLFGGAAVPRVLHPEGVHRAPRQLRGSHVQEPQLGAAGGIVWVGTHMHAHIHIHVDIHAHTHTHTHARTHAAR